VYNASIVSQNVIDPTKLPRFIDKALEESTRQPAGNPR
jgi:hypothetical protein